MSYEFRGPAPASPMLSKYFSLKDLTVTSLPGDNTPTPEALANLKKLAQVLDILREKVGPFKVISAYRSPANQAALKSGAQGGASASQAASKSFHSLGLAADLVPSTMTANQYFTAIAADSSLKNMLGEIAVKTNGPYLNPANTLHVSVATPNKTGVLMYVDAAGRYIRMAQDEVSQFLSKYKKPIIVTAGISVFLAAAFAIFMFIRSRKKA